MLPPVGLYFRKSVKAGPFRINLSQRGVGWSVGAKGFRTGHSPRGRSYTTFSLPGTGVGYRCGKGCALVLATGVALMGLTGWGLWEIVS